MIVGKDGALTDPDFHDGTVTGFLIDAGSLQFFVTDHLGQQWVMTVPEVLALSVSTFLQGNIVFEFSVFHKCEIPPEILEHFDTSYFLDGLRNVPKAVLDGKLLALQLVPTYGADLVALTTADVSKFRVEPVTS